MLSVFKCPVDTAGFAKGGASSPTWEEKCMEKEATWYRCKEERGPWGPAVDPPSPGVGPPSVGHPSIVS